MPDPPVETFTIFKIFADICESECWNVNFLKNLHDKLMVCANKFTGGPLLIINYSDLLL